MEINFVVNIDNSSIKKNSTISVCVILKAPNHDASA